MTAKPLDMLSLDPQLVSADLPISRGLREGHLGKVDRRRSHWIVTRDYFMDICVK